MRASVDSVRLIKKYEGLHDGDLSRIGLQPKRCPAGIWTVGWGTALRDRKGELIRDYELIPREFLTIGVERANDLLNVGIRKYEGIVNRAIEVPLYQNEFDALVCHAYNTGGSAKLFRLVNARASKEEIENWWTRSYITAGGKVLKGLVKRRVEEVNLFFKL